MSDSENKTSTETAVHDVVLLPCPFCGGDVKLQKSLTLKWVECRRGRCNCHGPVSESDYEAVTHWNMREDSSDAAKWRELQKSLSWAVKMECDASPTSYHGGDGVGQ